MLCPYCSSKTESGFIQTGDISWRKDDKWYKPEAFAAEMNIHKKHVFDPPMGKMFFKAELCRNCKKIIFDYSDVEALE